MPFTINTKEQHVALELTGSVTARDVSELAAELASSLTAAANVVIGTSGLDDIDTSVLQLLVSLRKTVNAFAVADPSEVFISAVDRCALRRELLAGSKEVG